jgi:tetratricopeptide (TPR) repeat protein
MKTRGMSTGKSDLRNAGGNQWKDRFVKECDNLESGLRCGQIGRDIWDTVQCVGEYLSKQKSLLMSEDERLYWKARGMLADAYDYWGKFEEAREIVGADGRVFYDQLETVMQPRLLEERKLLLEKVRFVLAYAQTLYRQYQYEDAKTIILKCQKFLNEKLRDEIELPCFGTQALANYILGRICRHLNQLDDAQAAFAQSIALYWQRAQYKQSIFEKDRKNKDRLREAIDFSNYKVAKCMALGLGWINYTRGYYRAALEQNIRPARVMLALTGDNLNKARLDLLEGCICRATTVEDHAALLKAETLLEQSFKVFKHEYCHPYYAAWASYNLVVLYLSKGDIENAKAYLEEVRRISETSKNAKIECFYWILRSRMELKQKAFKNAESSADCAVKLAEGKNEVICRMDALIARARAYLSQGSTKDARKDFEAALDIANSENPKIEAVCHLGLAAVYLQETEGLKAQAQMNEWNKIKDKVEHARIQRFGEEMEEMISKSCSQYFVLEPTLNYRKNLARLQKMLCIQARLKEGVKTDAQVAEVLGVARQTLFDWMAGWGE